MRMGISFSSILKQEDIRRIVKLIALIVFMLVKHREGLLCIPPLLAKPLSLAITKMHLDFLF